LAADLTGFCRGQRRRILFLGSPFFARVLRPEPAGTFVPKPDWFCSRRAALLYRAVTRTEAWKKEVHVMLSWVVTFLIIALIAGILGFGGIAGASIEIAKVIFFIAVILFLISAVVGLARGRTRV
jgi:uncharacterized membrane protein YtjA (UPF0391 family)